MTARDVVQRYADAYAAGDLTTVLAMYADDVVFHYFGETDLAGDHVGKDAAVAKMIEASSRSTRTLLEVVDVLGGEHRAAMIVRERFERDDETADVTRTFVYRVADEHLVECWLLDEDQRLIDRFWRPPAP
jgi:hypothetical protein